MVHDVKVDRLLKARLMVAALGERLARPWWRSQFLTSPGLRMIERVFPRTALAAALASATVAARRDHDANVGPRRFHLFRLPSGLEHQLVEAAASLGPADLPATVEDVLDALAILEPKSRPAWSLGPKSLGQVTDLSRPSIFGAMASLYVQAAQREQRSYPYFEARDDD